MYKERILVCLQPFAYLELVRYLGEIRSTGDKGHRLLTVSILPRLMQFEGLPASVVPQLLQFMGTGDDRCITFLQDLPLLCQFCTLC